MPLTSLELAEELAHRERNENRRRGRPDRSDTGAHPDDFADLPEQPLGYLIWSEEHGAWWNPNRAGYTTSMRRAGRYTQGEAEAIVESANYGRAFNEAVVPFTRAMKAALDLAGSGR